MTKPKVTREQWLVNAANALRPLFAAAKYEVPKNLKLTCGFPSKHALAGKNHRIGECWSDKASAGKMFEIFISPHLDKVPQVLETVVHEIVHATVGLEAKHRAPFARCAKAVGLEGKMTATHAGDFLAAQLAVIAKDLGTYPHQRMLFNAHSEKKQTTRLLKACCPECEYTIRITRAWIEAVGLPACPACEVELEEAA